MGLPLLEIVVINWSGGKYLERCLRSLSQMEYPNCAITLLDPRQETNAAQISADYPSLNIAPSKGPMRHPGILNSALRIVSRDASLIAILDSSVEVDRNWATEVVNAARRNDRGGILIPLILFGECRDTIFSSGIALGTMGHIWESSYGKLNVSRLPDETAVSPHWSAAVFTRDAIDRVGFFRKEFSIHFDMMDYSLRAIQAGFHCVRVPMAAAYQMKPLPISDSMSKSWYLVNQAQLIMKFFPLGKGIPAILRLMKNTFLCKEGGYLVGAEIPDRLCRPKALVRILKSLPLLICGSVKALLRRGEPVWPHANNRSTPPKVLKMRAEASECAGSATRRVIMGVDDCPLCGGWFEVKTDRSADVPTVKYRWMSRKGVVRLMVAEDGPSVLQLHLSNPFSPFCRNSLQVYIDGAPGGRIAIGDSEWRTYHLPLTVRRGPHEVALEADHVYSQEISGEYVDVSVKVSEIAILEENSPLVRESLPG